MLSQHEENTKLILRNAKKEQNERMKHSFLANKSNSSGYFSQMKAQDCLEELTSSLAFGLNAKINEMTSSGNTFDAERLSNFAFGDYIDNICRESTVPLTHDGIDEAEDLQRNASLLVKMFADMLDTMASPAVKSDVVNWKFKRDKSIVQIIDSLISCVSSDYQSDLAMTRRYEFRGAVRLPLRRQ